MATRLLKAKKEVRIPVKFHLGCQEDESIPLSCSGGCLVGIGQSTFLVLEEWLTWSFPQHFFMLHPYFSHPRSS